jgi:hypothetical protein
MNLRRDFPKAHYRVNSMALFEDDLSALNGQLVNEEALFVEEEEVEWTRPELEVPETWAPAVFNETMSVEEEQVRILNRILIDVLIKSALKFRMTSTRVLLKNFCKRMTPRSTYKSLTIYGPPIRIWDISMSKTRGFHSKMLWN